MDDYTIIQTSEVEDAYADTDVPGEYRSLTKALHSKQLAATFIHVPPHSDFEQSTGHYHKEIEEIYIITRGTLTMRLGNDIHKVSAGTVIRVAPSTRRSHRNEGDEPVDMWAISPKLEYEDATKIENFWEASVQAAQTKQ